MKFQTLILMALGLNLSLGSCACSKVDEPDGNQEYRDPHADLEAPVDFSDEIIMLDLRSFNSINRSDKSAVLNLWDTFHAISSVQGIVNRDTPRLYINYVKNGSTDVDSYWWDMYRKPGKWLATKQVREMDNVLDVFRYFKPLINGLVVWDPAVPSTSNVASTVAGADNLIAVRYDTDPSSMYNRLIGLGYEVKVRLIGEDGKSIFKTKLEPYRWAIDNYLKTGKCNTRFAAYYIDAYWIDHCSQANLNHHCLTNHDFFIGKKAFFFDLSPWGDEIATDVNADTYPNDPSPEVGADCEMMKEMLLECYRHNGNGQVFTHIGGFPAWAFKYTRYGTVGGSHGEVDTEWEFARVISAYNAYKDADAIGYGAMANASFWKNFPLKDKYPQKWSDMEQLKAKGYVTADGKVNKSKKYFIFYVGDWDAASWLYQMTPQLWDEKNRGNVPMMWAISPALEVRAPMAMEYLRSTASDMDYFVAADNGAGYLNPSMLAAPRPISNLPSGLDAWAEHCKPMYNRWDMTVTGFIIDGFCAGMNEDCMACYKKFSPNGIVPQKVSKYAKLYDGMPILKSGPDINDGSSSVAAASLVSLLNSHPIFPFYWSRAILKSPSWYLDVRNRAQAACPEMEWVDAPTFFTLLKMYLEEGNFVPAI